MQLSEAIRLGAMLRPQGFGKGFDGIGTCAWGAAFEAAGFSPRLSDWMPRWDTHEFHALFKIKRPCPHCGQNRSTQMILHLNDEHRWTRERIADWVESIEPQPAPVVVERDAVEA